MEEHTCPWGLNAARMVAQHQGAASVAAHARNGAGRVIDLPRVPRGDLGIFPIPLPKPQARGIPREHVSQPVMSYVSASSIWWADGESTSARQPHHGLVGGREGSRGNMHTWKHVCSHPTDWAIACASRSTAVESAPWRTVR